MSSERWCWGEDGFIAELVKGIPRLDWPDPITAKSFWDKYVAQFDSNGIVKEEAIEAIGVVAGQKMYGVADFLPAIVTAANDIKQRKSRNNPLTGSYIQASRESQECPECFGDGWASREFMMPSHVDVPLHGAMYCRCPAGRAIKRCIDSRRDTDKDGSDLYRQVDDLQSHPGLWCEQSKLFSSKPNAATQVFGDAYWRTV